MKKDDIPPLYTLAVYYKRKATQMLNNPYIIKDRVKKSKDRMEGICRRFNIWKPFHKLVDADDSGVHLVIGSVLTLIGAFFWYWFWAHIKILSDSMYNSPTGHFQFIYILSMAVVWSFAGMVLFLDAFARWLVKVNKIEYRYSELEKKRLK